MRRTRLHALAAWLAPVLFLGAVAGAIGLVRARPLGLVWILVGALVIVPAGWVLVSALFPGRADRRCPSCGRDALARLDPRRTHGLLCRACGWRDESASAWLLAEEEGALEELVLSGRGPEQVDSPRRPG